jgi:hypothetical protein
MVGIRRLREVWWGVMEGSAVERSHAKERVEDGGD